MKKFYYILALVMVSALSFTSCSKEDDLEKGMKFEVEVNGNSVKVTPSELDREYLCALLSSQEIQAFAQIMGEKVDTPEGYFKIARSMYEDSLFVGVKTIDNLPDDDYVLVASVVKRGEVEDEVNGGKMKVWLSVGGFTIEKFTVSVNGGPGDVTPVDMSFAFECTNDAFTITPSIDSEEYVFAVFSPAQLKEYGIFQEFSAQHDQINFTFNNLMNAVASMGAFVGQTFKGKITQTQADSEEPFTETGHYLVVIAGVKPYGKAHVITTPISFYDWNITSLTNSAPTEVKALQTL